MLAELLRPGTGITRVILTQAVHPRAQDPEELAELVKTYSISPELVLSVGQAVRLALATAESEEVILACGSLFVVAEASAAVRASELVSD